jgi:hypothetical protein
MRYSDLIDLYVRHQQNLKYGSTDMRISFGIPIIPEPQPRDNTFQDIKSSEDFHAWQGNACTLPLPGGGNNPTGPGGQGDRK